MNKYTYKVVLIVEVPAFSETDAFEILQDVFGVGDEYGLTVTECEYDDVGRRAK